MRDRISKQETATLEFYEKYGKVPVDGDGSSPTEPIVRRLIERELLEIILPEKGEMFNGVDITERGLTALRCGDWKKWNSEETE